MFDINFSNKQKVKTKLSSSDLNKLISFLKENGGNHVSHLIFLKDKEFFWTKDQNVLIVYKQIANKLIALGDPIGNESKIQESIKEFCEFSKSRGLKPIFYQISPRYMEYYHDSGYRFLKVGEQGLVNLQQFTLEGKQGAKLRNKLNKFTRHSYTFSVVHPPYSEDLLSELKRISDSWLGDKKEKGFSVVSFNEEYVSRFPVAILYCPDGSIVAFATLASDYKNTITIDLMRKSSDTPHGTMDVLFIQIFKWAKNNGYKTCSLGMSPLSNVGKCAHSFTSERLIHLAYLYGNSFYNFKGLKEFKDKFTSSWEPKYLAYKKSTLPIIFLQLLLLINAKQSNKNNAEVKNKIFLKRGIISLLFVLRDK